MLSASIERTTPEVRSSHPGFLIGRERFEANSPGLADAIARAHADHRRPRCLCQQDGVEMYIARLAHPTDGFIVKRMPESGHLHAPDCPSYEPSPEYSGLGQVLGSAIIEDTTTGQTILKLDFPLTKVAGRSTLPPVGDAHDSVRSDGSRLTLRGLLHYLWDQAELTRWHPGFEGRRSWETVRRYLLAAADDKVARGDPLRTRLYIPETFSVEQREPLNARRLAHWSRILPRPGKPAQALIVIGEIKELLPSRFGYKAIIKHLPDQPFALDENLYRRLERRFEASLSLWGTTEGLHMMAVATFALNIAGLPTLNELALMPVTSEWLPVDDTFDVQLTARLVCERRSFIKPLRYNLATGHTLPSALLTDTDNAPTSLTIEQPDWPSEQARRNVASHASEDETPAWRWRVAEERTPVLPPPRPVTAQVRSHRRI